MVKAESRRLQSPATSVMIRTERVDLIPATAEHLRAELADRRQFERAIGVDVSPSWPPELYDQGDVNFYLSLAFLAVSGMADNISVVIRSTLLQLLTPAEMLGRVSAVNSVFIGSSNELGAFESGVAARLLGTVQAVVLGGVASLMVVGVTARLVPRLRQLRKIG